ncbi:tryptophan 2,3-dioxygenase family protein [Umezawaea sp. Da 62-37]|uniref:tryptophan 2,3-dioxygenase family protein n=1 Tax=Umezawaea sp. Da 62-37 TaxID=3075927 RepID=UPI0028F6CC1E|nr:tryptophan 2,3-dioxygenase family protein [Umezawaea sp. Da 62-37]WNV92166.1 tryptophan 2,3-dioxygenase family protein [Umezawaea sp. Da 62-37]
MNYSGYLHLKELLALQNPLTPSDQQDLHDSERLFIVVHQASETLLSQAIADLRHIEAGDCGENCSAYRVDRATHIVHALVGHLELMHRTLEPEDFMRFRDRFGTASGLQSPQFHELFRTTERLTTGNTGRELGVEPLQLLGLSAAIRQWRYTHLKMVEHMIGSLPGSGDTSGLEYLERQLNGTPRCEYADGATAGRPRTHS